MDKLKFTDWSQVNWMFGCGEIVIFRQRMMFATTTFAKQVFWFDHSCCKNLKNSKWPPRRPQNGRRGLERGVPLSFWALLSTFAKLIFLSEHGFYEKWLWQRKDENKRQKNIENNGALLSCQSTAWMATDWNTNRSCQKQTWAELSQALLRLRSLPISKWLVNYSLVACY